MEEKKEIWKLIELLNEFWEYDLVEHKWEICKWPTDDETGEINIYTDYTNNIISKQFWFIKWLVENDKINKDLVSRVLIRAYISPKNLVSLECEFYDYYESLLMLLSIQDEPIRFLCEIIK